MKELTYSKKVQVIKFFLNGLSYDEVGQKAGIGKGSVVNIIDEFKDGYLSLPPETTEYIDELRHLVVDMKKHGVTVPQLITCVKLNAKLQKMGVESGKVDLWLDICQDIATPTVSTGQFVKATLELAQLESDSGLSYGDVIADYNSKLTLSKTLDAEIEQKEDKISELKLTYIEEKKQATDSLNSINKAVATAGDAFQKQKKEIKSQLDEYMVQNKLSWEKVNTVMAILQSELSKADLSDDDTGEISKDIAKAGSIFTHIKQLETRKKKLEVEVSQFTNKMTELKTNADNLGKANKKLLTSLVENGRKKIVLMNQLKEQEDTLAKLQDAISECIDVISITDLIMGALLSPGSITDKDIEQLTRFILFIRQRRLGIDPKQIKYVNNELLYECKIPRWYFEPAKYGVDMKDIRRKLAICLVPSVQTYFMPRFEWDAKRFGKMITKLENLHDIAKEIQLQQ